MSEALLGWVIAVFLIGFLVGICMCSSVESDYKKELTFYQKKYGLLNKSEWDK